jgi:hypothetical protein
MKVWVKINQIDNTIFIIGYMNINFTFSKWIDVSI